MSGKAFDAVKHGGIDGLGARLQLEEAIRIAWRRGELAGEPQQGNGADVQVRGPAMMIALILGLALSGCAGALPSAGSPAATSNNAGPPAAAPAADENAPAAAAVSGPQRDLSPEEKKIIMAAVAPSLRDAGAAKYHWAKFPVASNEYSPSYCAIVDAKSPYAAYNGRQAYIVEVTLAGGYVTSATMGMIAGGKDAALVRTMCEKNGLDPNKAS